MGGVFWDGRATGWRLGDPLAEQAQGPFLNPLEQNTASAQIICQRVAVSSYATLYAQVWGQAPNCTDDVNTTYDRIAMSIASFERSSEVNPYSSKYDHYLRGQAQLSRQERIGLRLFNGKAKCSACHNGPEFTDYTYDNLGVPRNPDNPFYTMDKTYNLDGAAWVDPGLGGFLASLSDWKDLAPENMGKHKVPTLRNVALAPRPNFVKAYMHNGVFKSLEEVVHFYNTRDLPSEHWAPPEVPENVNADELGDLGLSPSEEADLVAFLGTLSDGWHR